MAMRMPLSSPPASPILRFAFEFVMYALFSRISLANGLKKTNFKAGRHLMEKSAHEDRGNRDQDAAVLPRFSCYKALVDSQLGFVEFNRNIKTRSSKMWVVGESQE